ncbi:origin of replication complex subunit 1B isoform X1 [Selaginella moellendorffii]|uniref:origin of replication complex subunit 1B isoform X1 n=1 Tax=Selaginella moellendorffii TaxID=88036 RepID=UPI000D1C7251|nr:origin of replication complex subunit 1B isoform X1 [Selaginella moellendorffii]|eukprot:XP_024534221.1 origin of replication complex subunit 1B isoform X1 [Selaginella moellendorffii]
MRGRNAGTPPAPRRQSPRFASPSSHCDPSPKSPQSLGLSPAPRSVKRDLGFSPVLLRARSRRKSRDGDRKYVSRIEWNDGVFEVGEDVYVRKLESAERDESDEEVEDCRVCGKVGGEVMIECDACLGGFHLGCLEPPLEEVPEGDWICFKCEKKEAVGEEPSRRRHRTARERLLAKELWAARIERLWMEADGSPWFSGRWYLVPEETASGRQPHNGSRELFRTKHVDHNEVESILRHCYVFCPEDFSKASNEGDDVFYCEYEYDMKWHTFKRIVDLVEEADHDFEEYDESKASNKKRRSSTPNKTPNKTPKRKSHTEVTGSEVLRRKIFPEDSGKDLTEIEKAKIALSLSTTPGSLPCREKECKEIEAFVTDALKEGLENLGKCLYISGVPGTGKTATVLDVMRRMEKKLSSKEIQPFRFVAMNGLRLTSPEQTYTVLHEALTGQRLSWKRALQLLDERFSNCKSLGGVDSRPCILLVDELDLLVTRSQSVLYNLFDWPCRPNSRLMVIGIANTIDLPERLLPRIASRMGLQRVSFSPYSYIQLQEIISFRLSGTEAFEKPAVEFASRKVAAVSGDARRALELCRRAAELVECRQKSGNLEGRCTCNVFGCPDRCSESNTRLIGMADVEAAVTEMFQAPHVQAMRMCSKHAKIFLVAMVYEYHRTGMVETTFEQVSRAHSLLCSNNGEQPPDKDVLLSIGCKLGECRLLLCETGSRHRLQKLQLNFPSDDVSFALRECLDLPWIAKYLS